MPDNEADSTCANLVPKAPATVLTAMRANGSLGASARPIAEPKIWPTEPVKAAFATLARMVSRLEALTS